MIEGLEKKRDSIVYHLDQCLALAETDPIRAMAAIDESRKGMQALYYRIWESGLVTGGRHKRPAFAADVDG